MKTAIGANAKIKWLDETSHPEHKVESYEVYFSFSDEPDFSELKGNEVDNHGVRDDQIFFYVEDEEALKELIEYPSEFMVFSNYDIVYKD